MTTTGGDWVCGVQLRIKIRRPHRVGTIASAWPDFTRRGVLRCRRGSRPRGGAREVRPIIDLTRGGACNVRAQSDTSRSSSRECGGHPQLETGWREVAVKAGAGVALGVEALCLWCVRGRSTKLGPANMQAGSGRRGSYRGMVGPETTSADGYGGLGRHVVAKLNLGDPPRIEALVEVINPASPAQGKGRIPPTSVTGACLIPGSAAPAGAHEVVIVSSPDRWWAVVVAPSGISTPTLRPPLDRAQPQKVSRRVRATRRGTADRAGDARGHRSPDDKGPLAGATVGSPQECARSSWSRPDGDGVAKPATSTGGGRSSASAPLKCRPRYRPHAATPQGPRIG